ncbi:MAG: phosphodiester glycosidase family protein [Bacteroidota bacterium]
MKYLLLFLLQVIVLQHCLAQEDSLAFVHAKWAVKKIAPGVELRQCWFDHSLFGSNQNISILEIKLNKKNRIDVEADSTHLKPTSAFGVEHDALAAINGTFFDMKNGGSVDYIRLDGKVLNETRLGLGKNTGRTFYQKAGIVISPEKVSIEKWNGAADWENHLPGEDVIVTGPLLIEHHIRVQLDTISFYVNRHPRTAVALIRNKVLLITVDGRNQKAAGMSLSELANILKWLQADEGVNLDGGGSTTMWINHFPNDGVVNYPSDNKKMEKSALYTPGMDLDKLPPDTQKWDHSGQRPVANVLVVNKKK